MEVEIRVADDAEEAARIAGRELASGAAAGGHLALAGGCPRRAYQLAAAFEPSWHRVELWWTDERCVEPGDPRSNYRLVRESLLDRLARLPRLHRIRGEIRAEAAAAAYAAELRGVRLELAFLGLGPDAHTASLFPGSPALREPADAAVAAEPGLEPFVPRVTMTVPTLSAAALVLFLATGEEKAEAALHAFSAEPSPATPASLVRSQKGRTVAVLDPAAASLLPA